MKIFSLAGASLGNMAGLCLCVLFFSAFYSLWAVSAWHTLAKRGCWRCKEATAGTAQECLYRQERKLKRWCLSISTLYWSSNRASSAREKSSTCCARERPFLRAQNHKVKTTEIKRILPFFGKQRKDRTRVGSAMMHRRITITTTAAKRNGTQSRNNKNHKQFRRKHEQRVPGKTMVIKRVIDWCVLCFASFACIDHDD